MPIKLVKEFPLEEEYQKNTGITPKDITVLREWLKTQPHLPGDHITDLDLILTYHSCGRSTEVTKQVLDMNYTLRTHFSAIFKDRTVDDRIERTLSTVLLNPLPTRTKEGYKLIYTNFVDLNPKNMVLPDVIRTMLMVLDLCQYQEGTWPGLLLAVNFQGVVLVHLATFDLTSVQQLFYYLQEAMVVKLKGIHFINAPTFMDKILSMLKPFLKNSLLNQIYIHQAGSDTFNEYYPQEALPKECGGSYKSLKECKEDILNELKSNQEFFEVESKKRVVEAKRPGKPKTVTDFYGGIEGSFKKLDID